MCTPARCHLTYSSIVEDLNPITFPRICVYNYVCTIPRVQSSLHIVCEYVPYNGHYRLWYGNEIDGQVSIEIEADHYVVDHNTNCNRWERNVKRTNILWLATMGSIYVRLYHETMKNLIYSTYCYSYMCM